MTHWPASSTSTRSWPPSPSSRWGSPASTRKRTFALTPAREAGAVIDAVEDWQEVYLTALGRRLVHAADEYYVMADRAFPPAERYDGFPMHEDGVGMARTFDVVLRPRRGGHRDETRVLRRRRRSAPTRRTIALRARAPARPQHRSRWRRGARRRSGSCPASSVPRCCNRSSSHLHRDDVRVIPVINEFFGGNTERERTDDVPPISVGSSATSPQGIAICCPTCAYRTTAGSSTAVRVADLPRAVEVVATDGRALRAALAGRRGHGC